MGTVPLRSLDDPQCGREKRKVWESEKEETPSGAAAAYSHRDSSKSEEAAVVASLGISWMQSRCYLHLSGLHRLQEVK